MHLKHVGNLFPPAGTNKSPIFSCLSYIFLWNWHCIHLGLHGYMFVANFFIYIWRCQHCRLSAMTLGLGFSGLIRRNIHLLQHTWRCRGSVLTRILTFAKFSSKIHAMPILIHQMRFSTFYVFLVMFRPKTLEIRGEKQTKPWNWSKSVEG
jgi:hypothetical protein